MISLPILDAARCHGQVFKLPNADRLGRILRRRLSLLQRRVSRSRPDRSRDSSSTARTARPLFVGGPRSGLPAVRRAGAARCVCRGPRGAAIPDGIGRSVAADQLPQLRDEGGTAVRVGQSRPRLVVAVRVRLVAAFSGSKRHQVGQASESIGAVVALGTTREDRTGDQGWQTAGERQVSRPELCSFTRSIGRAVSSTARRECRQIQRFSQVAISSENSSI